jgi:hypothetical protein
MLSKITGQKDVSLGKKAESPFQSVDQLKEKIVGLKQRILESFEKFKRQLEPTPRPIPKDKLPLSPGKTTKRRGGPTAWVSDQDLIKLLIKHHGDAKKIAKEIGYSEASVVRNRIRRAGPSSTLNKVWKQKKIGR